MILSTGRKYVFIHIPKTGGTSLALALEARAKADDILVGDTPKSVRRRKRVKTIQTRGRLWKHSTLTDIEGLVPDHTLRDLFAFTLVRNPWDRAVSLYHWLKVQSFEHPSIDLARQLSFPDFAMNAQITQAFRNAPARVYMQHANGDEQCNAYIRLEHFEEDSASLTKHLGFDLALPQANSSERDRDYRRYFTDAAAESIAACCDEDIMRFGYMF